jgi:hypothetical protein
MPNGGYSVDRPSFATSVDNPPLHALASGSSGGNGVYAYATGSTFPTNMYQSTNYWVDVVFTTTLPPSNGTPTATPTVTLTPTVTPTPSVTPTPGCPCSIWSSSATPSVASDPDPNSIEVGVKFSSDVNGFITGIRYYRGPANSGPHTGNLWSSTGQLLATAAFANESATGWQQVPFGSPVAITANTTYVASYHMPNGGYSVDRPSFATSVDNPPLHALASGSSGGNGVYAYASGSTFPTNMYQSTNYWVDVVFVLH